MSDCIATLTLAIAATILVPLVGSWRVDVPKSQRRPTDLVEPPVFPRIWSDWTWRILVFLLFVVGLGPSALRCVS